MENVLKRVRPKRVGPGRTKFEGWSRMCIPVRRFEIQHVAKPNVGERKPAVVKALVTLSLHHFEGKFRDDWEKLRKHDVIFLMHVEYASLSPSRDWAGQCTVWGCVLCHLSGVLCVRVCVCVYVHACLRLFVCVCVCVCV